MIILTLDTDWAPDYILDATLQVLVSSNIKTTVFATHQTPLLRSLPKTFEIGLHPNITDITDGATAIRKIKDLYPDARCIRNHSLVSCNRFLHIYHELGISVSSNYLMANQSDIKPVPLPYGITEYPIFFMDDVALIAEKELNPDRFIATLTDLPGLKVLAFHPVHIYLNTTSFKEYEKVKSRLGTKSQDSKNFINAGIGIKSLFTALVHAPALTQQSSFFKG